MHRLKWGGRTRRDFRGQADGKTVDSPDALREQVREGSALLTVGDPFAAAGNSCARLTGGGDPMVFDGQFELNGC